MVGSALLLVAVLSVADAFETGDRASFAIMLPLGLCGALYLVESIPFPSSRMGGGMSPLLLLASFRVCFGAYMILGGLWCLGDSKCFDALGYISIGLVQVMLAMNFFIDGNHVVALPISMGLGAVNALSTVMVAGDTGGGGTWIMAVVMVVAEAWYVFASLRTLRAMKGDSNNPGAPYTGLRGSRIVVAAFAATAGCVLCSILSMVSESYAPGSIAIHAIVIGTTAAGLLWGVSSMIRRGIADAEAYVRTALRGMLGAMAGFGIAVMPSMVADELVMGLVFGALYAIAFAACLLGSFRTPRFEGLFDE